MPEFLGVIGINHKDTPIEVRDKCVFCDTMKMDFMQRLSEKGINQIVILSTCNRSEIYFYDENILEKSQIVFNEYVEFLKIQQHKNHIFCLTGKKSLEYLFEVTSGLQSIVVGEDQILGQVKDSLEFSINFGFAIKKIIKIFREAITTAKKNKNKYKISEIPLSTSYIGVKLLIEKLGNLKDKKIFILGAGKMNMLTLKYLKDLGVNDITLCNRSIEKVDEFLNKNPEIKSITFNDRYKTLQQTDILITATASPHAIIKTNDIPKINKPLTILDIAMPRDVEQQVASLENVNLYDIDDLKEISIQNLEKRKEIADKIKSEINVDIIELENWLENEVVDVTIKSINQKCLEVHSDVMRYINKKIEPTPKQQKIIDKAILTALKRVLREPIINIKLTQDKNKQKEYKNMLNELFGFDEIQNLGE